MKDTHLQTKSTLVVLPPHRFLLMIDRKLLEKPVQEPESVSVFAKIHARRLF